MTERTNYTHEDAVIEGEPLITVVTVGTGPTPLPAVPMQGRNVLRIVNPDVPGAIRINLCNANGTGAIPIDPGDPPWVETTRDEIPIFYAFAAAPTDIQIQEAK